MIRADTGKDYDLLREMQIKSCFYDKFTKQREELNDELDNKDKEIERLNNIIKNTIKELFELKDMIYKPETREINFDVQRKISAMIVKLGSDKECI